MNVRRKIIITIALVVFSLTTLVTTTFAWFSIAQSATVGDLELTVTNGGSLLISLDGENYYDNLNKDLFGDYIKNGLVLKDVSTSDLNIFYNSYEGDEAIPNKDYLTFTLYFRCDDAEMDGLYLADNISTDVRYNYEVAENNKLKGTYVFSKGVPFKSPVTFQYSETDVMQKGQQGTFYAQDAIRFGFKELPFDDEDTRTEFAKVIFDPSANPDRGYGVEYGAFDFIRKYIDAYIPAPLTTPETVYQLTRYNYNYYAQNNDSLCASFQPRQVGNKTYYFAKVQVSVWLEGWDADCFDAIYKDSMLLQFYFRSAIKAE